MTNEENNSSFDSSQSNTNIGRRRVLRNVGAGFAVSGIGIGVASAEDAPSRFDTENLNGAEANRTLARLRETEEYRTLVTRAREDGYRVRFNSESAEVFRISRQRNPQTDGGEVQTLEIAYTRIRNADADEAFLTIGVDADTGSVAVAGLEFVETQTLRPEEYPISLGEGGSKATVPMTLRLVDATGTEVESETISIEQIAERGIGGAVGAASLSTDVTADDFFCFTCQANVDLLCFYGCGAPVWFLCGFLAIPTGGLGGLACGAFVAGACGLISLYGCAYAGLSRKVCTSLGFC